MVKYSFEKCLIQDNQFLWCTTFTLIRFCYWFLFQLWRLVTTFLYFGTFGFNFFFNMIFTYRYCRMLEEGSFRRRTADFVMMFLFGGVCMVVSFYILLELLGFSISISNYCSTSTFIEVKYLFQAKRSANCLIS